MRELENILEHTLAMADDDEVSTADLRLFTVPNPGTGARDPRTLVPRDTASSALPSYIEEIERAVIQQALPESR